MSSVVVHYDPRALHLIASQRVRSKEADRIAFSASSTSPSRNAAKRHARPDCRKQNEEMLHEVEEHNREMKERQAISALSCRVAEDQLRRPWNERLQHRTANDANGVRSSPRRKVRDLSGDVANEEAQFHGGPRPNLPPYFLRRKLEIKEHERKRIEEQAVVECERGFPKGKQPMDPDVAERTRSFLVQRQAELEKQIRDFPFKFECCVTGQRRKAELEEQLRDVECVLSKFQYPVVFVSASKPRLATPTSASTRRIKH